MAKEINHTFTLIFKRDANGYTIEAIGPKNIRVAPQVFSWQLTPEQKSAFKALSSNLDVPSDAIKELGKTLYDAVFIPPIATAYGQALSSVKSDQGMRIQIQLAAPELALIPWEALYDGSTFLATRSDYPLVRIIPLPQSSHVRQRLSVRGPLRILFVEAWPKDLPSLQREDEIGRASCRERV